MRTAGELCNFGTSYLLNREKADYYIRYLNSGVIDVILDVNFPAAEAQQSYERIAQDGIAKMSDVRGLVGVNTRVLDEDLAAGSGRARVFVGSKRSRDRGTVDSCVDVARTGYVEPIKTRNLADSRDHLLGNFPRGLAEFLCQFEG